MERTGAVDRHGVSLENNLASLPPSDIGGGRAAVATELAGEGFCQSPVPTRNREGRAPGRQSAGRLRAKHPVTAEDKDAPQKDLRPPHPTISPADLVSGEL